MKQHTHIAVMASSIALRLFSKAAMSSLALLSAYSASRTNSIMLASLLFNPARSADARHRGLSGTSLPVLDISVQPLGNLCDDAQDDARARAPENIHGMSSRG